MEHRHVIRSSPFRALLILTTSLIVGIASQVHVDTIGSPCSKHTDCVRYCAYSKYGLEGASCCFPEKIRVSRTEWIHTGSTTCYCCDLPDNYSPSSNLTKMYLEDGEERMEKIAYANHPSTTGTRAVVIGTGDGDACKAYLEAGQARTSAASSKVKGEFCSKRCVQVMVNVKLAFEYPSVCRPRGDPTL